MKYLTKEWYELCQRTGLHYGMEENKGAAVNDESFYLQLYKKKENEFVKSKHVYYDIDPRFMLEEDGCTLVRLDAFVNDGEIAKEDTIVYHMPPEEREEIKKKIEEFDMRPPFDDNRYREEFLYFQENMKKNAREKLPPELIQQIADMRVFALGYCTKEVLNQLEKISNENEEKKQLILDEYSKVQRAENIPQNINESFGFHDCQVIEFTVDKNIVMRFDTRGGFTDQNKVTFVTSKVIKQENPIVGSAWIYHELYQTENGYEAHILFEGEKMTELIIDCNDIVIVKD